MFKDLLEDAFGVAVDVAKVAASPVAAVAAAAREVTKPIAHTVGEEVDAFRKDIQGPS